MSCASVLTRSVSWARLVLRSRLYTGPPVVSTLWRWPLRGVWIIVWGEWYFESYGQCNKDCSWWISMWRQFCSCRYWIKDRNWYSIVSKMLAKILAYAFRFVHVPTSGHNRSPVESTTHLTFLKHFTNGRFFYQHIELKRVSMEFLARSSP